jgi:hypothetical protein
MANANICCGEERPKAPADMQKGCSQEEEPNQDLPITTTRSAWSLGSHSARKGVR